MRYKLQELIDIKHFQNLQDRLNEIYSFPSSIIDNDGNILTATAWQDICTQFHRKNKETEKLCIQSDQYIKDHIHEANPAVSYRCPHGLVDNAMPIIIDGIHYGNFFTGQFFLEKPDLEFFKVQARKYGFDQDAYLKAVKDVPVWTQEQRDSYLFFIKGLIAVISESGLKTLKEIENREQIEVKEKRHKSILKTAMDGYWLTDTEGRLLEVNNTYCSMSGFSEDELLTMSIAELDVEENFQLVAQHMQEVIAQGSDRFESRHRRKNGTVFDVEISVQFRNEEGGQCVCFIRDISDSKLAEETQRRSELKYRQLVQTASDGIYFVSDTGKILDVNPSGCSMLGRTREEILQLNIDGVDPNFTTEEFLSFWEDVPYDEPRIFESTHQHKNGSLISVEVSGKKFRIGENTYYYGISRDITEREIARKALLSSEKKWRNILVNTPQIGVSINTEAKITFANNHFLKLTGWLEHEVIGQDWFDMFIPEHIREKVREVFFAVMSKKDTAGFSTYDNVIMDKKGDLINVAWSNVLTKDMDANVIDVTCLGLDVTERQRAEAALLESEAYMNSIFRAAPTGIGVVRDRIIIKINEKFCEMLGYSRDELLGRVSEFLYPSIEEFQRVGREKYKQIQENGTGTVETLLKRKNGEIVNVLMSSTPIDPNDLSAGVTFTALDITSRIQAENSLRDSHERFLTVLDSIDATIYVADMETYEILFMNRHMIDTFGRDMTGEICWKAFREESKPCSNCNNDRLVDNNNIPTGVSVWNDKNPITGKMYINHDRAIKWTDGRLVKLQIATDITDLLKIETQLRQAQKMESVGRLAGGVAHDFNNMLSVILGSTEMILEDLDGTNPATYQLQEVKKAAERSANLTRQLLAFARQQPVAPKVIDLNETVDGMLKMLRRLIGEDIDFTWIPRINLWPIKIDPSQIDQILANLCVNARDSIKGVGKITIETDNVNCDKDYCHDNEGFIPGDYVLIEVSDNGYGMNKETLANLFEPFFTTKSVGEGTGLGLSIVYGIVKQNNGFINVYSEVDQGTSFKIYFPRNIETVRPEYEKNSLEAAPEGCETILLVEDEESILGMITKILERLGYTVLTASSPNEAIRIVKEFKYHAIDLLITDVIMPEMNGLDLSNKLLTITPQLKCLFMSGYTADTIVHHGVLDQDIQFINKPFSKKDLAIKIREVLDEDKQRTQ